MRVAGEKLVRDENLDDRKSKISLRMLSVNPLEEFVDDTEEMDDTAHGGLYFCIGVLFCTLITKQDAMRRGFIPRTAVGSSINLTPLLPLPRPHPR